MKDKPPEMTFSGTRPPPPQKRDIVKKKLVEQCRVNIDPPSTTVDQYWPDIAPPIVGYAGALWDTNEENRSITSVRTYSLTSPHDPYLSTYLSSPEQSNVCSSTRNTFGRQGRLSPPEILSKTDLFWSRITTALFPGHFSWVLRQIKCKYRFLFWHKSVVFFDFNKVHNILDGRSC